MENIDSVWTLSWKYRFLCNIIVFMSPELSLSKTMDAFFSEQHVKENLVLVAIDECHCITDW